MMKLMKLFYNSNQQPPICSPEVVFFWGVNVYAFMRQENIFAIWMNLLYLPWENDTINLRILYINLINLE